MTTWRSSQTEPVPTMAGYIPPTVASRPVVGFDTAAPTAARQASVTDLAWSNEPPELASPLPLERPRPRFMRSGVLTFVGGGLVAAAAVGLFGALHGTHSTPVDTTTHSAPPPAAAPANPVPTPGNQTNSAPPTRSVMASRGSSDSTSHRSPSRYSPSSSDQHTNDQSGQYTNDQRWQSNHDSVSNPPTWNRNDYDWFTHRRDDDHNRWTRDHDTDDRSSGDHGDNIQSSH
jgi:hypothetical protein